MMTPDAIGYSARQILTCRSDILFSARDAGLATAVRTYFGGSHCIGGVGYGDDGVFRRWDFEGRRVQLRVGSFDAEPDVMPLAKVIEWALNRVTPAAWSDLERLRTARSEALDGEFGDQDLYHRMTYRPSEVTTEERTRVGVASRRRHEVEEEARQLVAGLLAPEAEVVGQLELFPTDDGLFAIPEQRPRRLVGEPAPSRRAKPQRTVQTVGGLL